MAEEKQELGYAFTWLTAFGKVQLEQFGSISLPQKAASAWSAAAEGITVAEQTLLTNPIVRRVVRLTINEFNGEYEIVDIAEILG